MSESSIATKILDAARQKAQATFDEAARIQEEALKGSLARLAAEMDEKRAAARKRLQESFHQDLSAFRLIETNRIHALRRKLLDGVFGQAWEAAAAGDRYRAYLEKQLRENCREGDVLVAPTAQKTLFQANLKPLMDKLKVRLSEETGRFRAGFVVVRGDVRLNCTLDETFKAAVRDSEIEIAEVMFQK
jgi:vacuolar-type H+-ATPase subunit E/Vma4